jgi:hypothetical protein
LIRTARRRRDLRSARSCRGIHGPTGASARGREFVGLDDPPAVLRGEAGREFVLRAATLGSHGLGVPVYFRRLPVGRIVGREVDADGAGVTIRIFVARRTAVRHPPRASGTRAASTFRSTRLASACRPSRSSRS